jgi:hypothetical protein
VTERVPFEYATLRVVPRIERGEFVNAGVIVYCRARDFLGARVFLDEARLRALGSDLDLEAVRAALAVAADTCAERGTGPAAAVEIGKRFRWLTAPRSTMIQPGPVHTGLTTDPAGDLERLLDLLVR